VNEHCDINKPCPHTVAIAMLDKDLSGFGSRTNSLVAELSGFGSRTNSLAAQLSELDKKTDDHAVEIGTMKTMISNYTSQSHQRHDDLKGYVVDLGVNLKKHMESEEKELRLHQTENKLFVKESLSPIKEALDHLQSRWWSIMIAIIGLLGSGLVGTIVYLWNHRDFLPK